MQDNDNKDLPVTLDEDVFYKALKQIENTAKQAFQTVNRQRDTISSVTERYKLENSILRSRLDGKNAELENLRKKLIDLQMKLAEFYRTENSLKLEVKQYKTQLGIYHVDAKKIAELEDAIRAAKDQNLALYSQIEVMNADTAKLERNQKAEMDKLSLKYEQEKILLQESIQIAEDKAKSAIDAAERSKSLANLAEQEKNAAIESAARAKQDQKQQIEKIQSELARYESLKAEEERRINDIQRSYERKFAVAEAKSNQEHQARIEPLQNTIEEQSHEINKLRYQIEQLKEDHKRTVETLKQDMEKQLELRAEQIRRQYILNSSQKSGTTQ